MNVIPASGRAGGTVRMLDAVAWADAEELVRDTIEQIVEPYGVDAEVTYVRGVPPVVNEHRSTPAARASASRTCSARRATWPPPRASVVRTSPGTSRASPARWDGSGTRTPGGPTYDLHQGDLRVDERAVSVGAKVLAAAALEPRWSPTDNKAVADRRRSDAGHRTLP